MAQLEELLEKKPDAVSEDMGYSTPSDAYPEDEWEKQNFFLEPFYAYRDHRPQRPCHQDCCGAQPWQIQCQEPVVEQMLQ